MPQQGAIQIEGLAGIQKALKAIDVPAKELSAVGFEAAKLVNITARQLTPVRTGRLKASIRASKVQRGAEGRAGNGSVRYANPIHWGWFRHHIKPNPFMLNALDKRRDEVLQVYVTNMQKLIDESVAKYAANNP
jgi:HK97 gp10 family phage protein